MKKPLLLVFCKNPSLGKVKTRLAKTIGDEKALQIYNALLAKTAAVLKELSMDIFLYYSDQIEEKDLFSGLVTQKKRQKGKDLGERMANAFQDNFSTHDAIVVIGTDLWTLEKNDIFAAFKALETQTAVIGPSSDGGYYLLGLKKYVPQVFQDKAWGTSSVLPHTINDLNAYGYHLIQEKNDVDTFSDLTQNPTLKACIQ